MQLTDIHIKENKPEQSLAYEKDRDGPRRLEEGEIAFAQAFHAKLKEEVLRDDFMIEFEGGFWRGRYDKRAVDGSWFRLRRIPPQTADLDNLPSPMPSAIKDVLMSSSLTKGGLIHVCGGTGCGKTTTGSATIVSRLKKFGGVAYTVEDPPEMPLNGWHGGGYCTQTWVAGDNASDWSESLRGVLRSQPTGTRVMLYVGEVRDAETARAMLRAASNGFLVVSTGFGDNPINGIDTFFQLMGRDPGLMASLAAVLRVVVHQKIDGSRFLPQILVSESPSSSVANLIRSNQLAQLQNEIMYQRNQLMAGNPLLAA